MSIHVDFIIALFIKAFLTHFTIKTELSRVDLCVASQTEHIGECFMAPAASYRAVFSGLLLMIFIPCHGH